jgi:predicted ATPase
MGIKYFGILQVLSDKNHFYNGQILILDEPEVHLHPKWQLELAKVIIELVKGGVRILVNSHSPYMIEALKRYSQIENLNDKTNFYLAQNGYIIQQDNLENIFEKLAIPMRELKNLKIKQYANN